MVFSLALFVPPEVLALNVNYVAAVRAFHLGVISNPADERLRLMMATGTFHIDFEAVRLALRHGNALAFIAGWLLRFIPLRG
jgi:hypothetical protein